MKIPAGSSTCEVRRAGDLPVKSGLSGRGYFNREGRKDHKEEIYRRIPLYSSHALPWMSFTRNVFRWRHNHSPHSASRPWRLGGEILPFPRNYDASATLAAAAFSIGSGRAGIGWVNIVSASSFSHSFMPPSKCLTAFMFGSKGTRIRWRCFRLFFP
jgi:hypothetical protein